MLREWPTHKEYQEKLMLYLLLFYQTDMERVVELEKSISKLYLQAFLALMTMEIRSVWAAYLMKM